MKEREDQQKLASLILLIGPLCGNTKRITTMKLCLQNDAHYNKQFQGLNSREKIIALIENMTYDENWVHLKFENEEADDAVWDRNAFEDRTSVLIPLARHPLFLIVTVLLSLPLILEYFFGIQIGHWKEITAGTLSLWIVIKLALLYLSIVIVYCTSRVISRNISASRIRYFEDVVTHLCCLLWATLCFGVYKWTYGVANEKILDFYLSFCVFAFGLMIQKWIIRAISNSFMSRSFKIKIYETNFKCYVIDALVKKCVPGPSAHPHPEPAPSDSSDSSYLSVEEEYGSTSRWYCRPFSCGWFRCGSNDSMQLSDLEEGQARNPLLNEPRIEKSGTHPLSFRSFINNFHFGDVFSKSSPAMHSPKSSLQAKHLARQVFRALSRTDKNYIVKKDFDRVFGADQFSAEAFGIFGIDVDQRINKLEFIAIMANILKTKHNLDRSIHLSFQALEMLDRFLNIILLIFMCIICFSIFGMYPSTLAAFSVSSIVTAGWIFGGVAKDAFNCLLLLFVTHPFDIGDILLMEGKKWTVQEINIFTTIFAGWGGEELCCPNANLVGKNFTNLTRNNEQYEIFSLKFGASLDQEVIQSFRMDMYTFLAQHATEFYPSFEFETGESNNLEDIQISLRIRCKLTADFRRIVDRKFILNNFIKHRLHKIIS